MIRWLVSLSREYLNIDLIHPAMRRMDLTALDLPDGSQTLIWCSHVLEHIPEDRAALSEMYRVLSPGGLLVVQVPVSGASTHEDAAIDTRAARLRHYLQEDHVRLYGVDLKERIESCGFTCEILSSRDLPADVQVTYSLRAALYREVFLCRRSS